jgi:hypothetical protein
VDATISRSIQPQRPRRTDLYRRSGLGCRSESVALEVRTARSCFSAARDLRCRGCALPVWVGLTRVEASRPTKACGSWRAPSLCSG